MQLSLAVISDMSFNKLVFSHYTIEKNIAIVPELKGWDKEKIKERVKELLNMVGLDPEIFSTRYPKELSGGQQQRVGVARALASNPSIILMDEPFGALDPITREQLQEELISLHKKLKKTFVFVTHDMDEALKLGDRIAIMRDGQLLQLDTPEKILHEPASGFVEEFIGKHRIIQNPDLMSVTDVMTEKVVTSLPHHSPEKALSFMRQRKTTALVIVDEVIPFSELYLPMICSKVWAVSKQSKKSCRLLNLFFLTQQLLKMQSSIWRMPYSGSFQSLTSLEK